MSVAITWIGGPTFAVSYRGIRFYMEPGTSAASAADADMLTVSGAASIDAPAIQSILAASTRAKVVLPKSVGEAAYALGIDYHRMTTTDAALRVEYFKNGEYGRVYGVPAARRDEDGQPRVDYTPIGGYPLIGFMSRFGTMTVWHSGSGIAYPELADRLRPYNPTVAIVAIGPQHFSESEAADLAEALDLQWLVPAPVSPEYRERFLAHALGHRPAVRFKLFEAGETWSVPE